MENEKLKQSIEKLKIVMSKARDAKGDDVLSDAISKRFESCFEYAWKHLKDKVRGISGIETFGPKDTIKAAARINLIDDLDLWLDFSNGRNLSVHDYLGIDEIEDKIELIETFLKHVEKVDLEMG